MDSSSPSTEKGQSEYELQRQKRIERNNERLKALGLLSRYEEQEAAKARKKAAASAAAKKRKSSSADPERKSRRVQSETEFSTEMSSSASNTMETATNASALPVHSSQGEIMYVASDRDKHSLSERHFRTFRQFMWFGEPDSIRRWTVCRHCHNKRHQKDVDTFSKNFHGLCKHVLEECPRCPKKIRHAIAASQTKGPAGSVKRFLEDLWERPTPDIASHSGTVPTKAGPLVQSKKKKKKTKVSDRPDVGDKLEVLWDLEVRGEQEKYWWKAEVISSSGKGRFAVVRLEYVPYPGAGYHQPSHQNVVFLDKNKLMDSDTKDECPYKVESKMIEDAELSDEEDDKNQSKVKVEQQAGAHNQQEESIRTTFDSQAAAGRKAKVSPPKTKKVYSKQNVVRKRTISNNKIIQTLAKNKNPAVLKGGFISATQQIVLPPRESKYDRSTWWNVDLDSKQLLNQGATPLFKRCRRNFGWSEEHASIVLTGYRQFLWLLSTESSFKNENAIPCTDVEQMWKEHASDTLHYLYDTHLLCGRVVFYEANRYVDNNEANANFAATCKALKEKFWNHFVGSLWSRRSQCSTDASAGAPDTKEATNRDEGLLLEGISLECASLAEMEEEIKTECMDMSNLDVNLVDGGTSDDKMEDTESTTGENVDLIVDRDEQNENDLNNKVVERGCDLSENYETESEIESAMDSPSATNTKVPEEREDSSLNRQGSELADLKNEATNGDFLADSASQTKNGQPEDLSKEKLRGKVEKDPPHQSLLSAVHEDTTNKEGVTLFSSSSVREDSSGSNPVSQNTSEKEVTNEGIGGNVGCGS